MLNGGLSSLGGHTKEQRRKLLPVENHGLKIMTPLEEAVVDAETFQLSSLANVVKVGSSLN